MRFKAVFKRFKTSRCKVIYLYYPCDDLSIDEKIPFKAYKINSQRFLILINITTGHRRKRARNEINDTYNDFEIIIKNSRKLKKNITLNRNYQKVRIMPVKTQIIPLAKLENNNGQIEGVPKNPRFIKDKDYQNLRQSIIDDPEMLDLRELLVYPQNGNFIVIGGNMRLKVLKELNVPEVPCKILDPKTPPEKLRAYLIKDNINSGKNDFDLLANEWDESELIDWGLEIPNFNIADLKNEPEENILQENECPKCGYKW